MKRAARLYAESKAQTASAPAWVVTYADMVTLLLCLFVAVLSMSVIRKDRFDAVLGSIQAKFGDDSRAAEAGGIAKAALEQRLHGVVPAVDGGEGRFETQLESAGAVLLRTDRGLQLVIGGPKVFERGDDSIATEAVSLVEEIASAVVAEPGRLRIRGHCAAESPEKDSAACRDLAYGRAAKVARILEEKGIAAGRLEVVAVGDGEPLAGHAYTQQRRALNRRVDIEIVDEDRAAIR